MNVQCPRSDNFSPAAWSRVSLGDTHSLQCAVCYRNGVKAHDSMYCTKQCFKSDWKRHCTTHTHNTSGAGAGGGAVSYKPDGTPRKGPAPGKGNRGDSVGEDDVPGGASAEEHWEHVGSGDSYIPTEDDVGHVLTISVTALSETNNSVVYGPMTIYTEPVLSQPRLASKRNMVPVQLQPGQQPVSPGTIKFRILSYNILAELYATKQAYPYSDSWLLSWPYRRSLIMQELEVRQLVSYFLHYMFLLRFSASASPPLSSAPSHANAKANENANSPHLPLFFPLFFPLFPLFPQQAMQGDIVCLQEVQMDHFEMHLSPFMHELGFDGLFKSKSRESMGQYGKVDGCATFWKLAKFSMTEHYTIEFNDLARHAISDMGLDPSEERKYINR